MFNKLFPKSFFCVNNILSKLLASTILCGGTERTVGDSRLHHVEERRGFFGAFYALFKILKHLEILWALSCGG